MASILDSRRTFVFKSMSTAGPKRYLNSSPDDSLNRSVYLSESMDFTTHPGTHWETIIQAPGVYRLKTMSARGGSDKRILDSSSAAPKNESVFLNTDSAGDGSLWAPTKLADGIYQLESRTPSGQKRYLSADVTASQEASVFLEQNSDAIELQWMIGMDYYVNAEIEHIITAIYPGLQIAFYNMDREYGTLDYDILLGIWNDSGLGNYQIAREKFDGDDYAICMKAAVAKYSYNQTLPADKGSLCGIIWGRNASGEGDAINFTIDPFKSLILFDPRTSQQLGHNDYTPFFCLM